MDATKVNARYPQLGGEGYVKEVWSAGEKRVNPAGDMDVVERIFLRDTWDEFLEVKWRDFGSELIAVRIITSIEFKDAGYTKLQAEKKRDREATDSARVQEVLGKNPV